MQQPDFIKSIKSKDSDANQSLIEKAYFFALEAHKSQKRYSGDPYISHPVKVAEILTNLKLDKSVSNIKSRNIFKDVRYKVSKGSEKNLKKIDITVEENFFKNELNNAIKIKINSPA